MTASIPALLDTDSQDKPIELGIDVSKWNGEIDWDVVKAEGVDYAIIRLWLPWFQLRLAD